MKQGEIWLINLDPTTGAEIKKTRPGVIVNDDSLGGLPLRVIVPMTNWKDKYEIASWMIKVEPTKANSLHKTSSADCFQVRSISEKRFIRKLGKIDSQTLDKIKEGLAKVFSMP